jgi:hypothetical protein
MGFSKAQKGLGFQDLLCFNKLLAKQLRVLLQNPNSLAGQVLRSTYILSII